MEILKQIAAELERGKDEAVRTLTQSALDESVPAPRILEEGLICDLCRPCWGILISQPPRYILMFQEIT